MKPISKMNKQEKAALVAEAKDEIPRLLAMVVTLHERMLRMGTPEALSYAAIIEDQIALTARIAAHNYEKVKWRNPIGR